MKNIRSQSLNDITSEGIIITYRGQIYKQRIKGNRIVMRMEQPGRSEKAESRNDILKENEPL